MSCHNIFLETSLAEKPAKFSKKTATILQNPAEKPAKLYKPGRKTSKIQHKKQQNPAKLRNFCFTGPIGGFGKITGPNRMQQQSKNIYLTIQPTS